MLLRPQARCPGALIIAPKVSIISGPEMRTADNDAAAIEPRRPAIRCWVCYHGATGGTCATYCLPTTILTHAPPISPHLRPPRGRASRQ